MNYSVDVTLKGQVEADSQKMAELIIQAYLDKIVDVESGNFNYSDVEFQVNQTSEFD
jgi:hypothetical protein